VLLMVLMKASLASLLMALWGICVPQRHLLHVMLLIQLSPSSMTVAYTGSKDESIELTNFDNDMDVMMSR
jgi:hypothetical protein